MQQEQSPQAFDGQPSRLKEGTIFEDGADVGINVGDLSRRDEIALALADINAATQSVEQDIEKRLEYKPLSPQEVVKLIGRKVVLDLRKGYNETHINLFEESVNAAPYFDQADRFEASTSGEFTTRTQATSKDDVDLAA